MRGLLLKLFSTALLLLFLLGPAWAKVSSEEAEKLLPNNVSDFQKQRPVLEPLRWLEHTQYKPEDFNIVSAVNRSFVSAGGEEVIVDLIQTDSDASAYALLGRAKTTGEYVKLDGVGTAGIAAMQHHAVAFCKGAIYAFVFSPDKHLSSDDQLVSFARALAASLDAGSGDIPTLVKHLPAWEAAQERAGYATTLPALREALPAQPVLDALSFEGGTEAVTARYEQGQLVIVEFTTPQLAGDVDARVVQRIAELRSAGQPVPAVYKREGNYAVFVFDAPSEQAANDLIGQVKYEKVVQWLGEDPHRFERANRFWLNMSSSLIVNTIKATGLAILLCLSVGGLFGGVIFMRRRAQAALSEKYSDAGGMMRLNLDELAAEQTPAARLLPPREE
jgi:hypothetical protein